MQQVSAEAFASAIAVDPASLPALIGAPRRRVQANVGRVWVLHRRLVLRAVLVMALLGASGVLYELRDRLGAEVGALYTLGERQLAHSPFGIAKISLTGLDLTNEREVLKALAIGPETSMINFDASAARDAIEQLPAVASATVRKGYPNHLYVDVTERVPVARWRVDGVTYIIDPSGVKMGVADGRFDQLPLVIGDAAGDDAMVMIRALNRYPKLTNGLIALSRIGDRRWDMIYKSGLRVKLPEQGVAQALQQLSTLEERYQLLERDVVSIDLRVAGMLALKPSAAAAAQLDAIAKATVAKNKVKFKQDADYSAPGTH